MTDPHRLLFPIICCGGWNEPYAGDVAAVRAGLHRRILLRLRKSAKNIETGAELASGSDSSPCLNNADSRSLSSITPPPQQPIPLPHPRLEIQPQRTENRSECTSCPVPKKTQYIKKIGTASRIQYRSIQKPDRHSVSHPIPKHTQIGLTTSRIPVKQQTETILGTASHTQHRSIQTKVNTLPSSTTKNSLKKAQGCAEGRGLVPLCGFLFHKK